jgi:hypothetical protein
MVMHTIHSLERGDQPLRLVKTSEAIRSPLNPPIYLADAAVSAKSGEATAGVAQW